MPVLDILTIPNVLLKKVSPNASKVTPEIAQLAGNLISTMRHNKGCVGLAAPQTGNLQRVIVFDVSLSKKSAPNRGLTVIINPVITSRKCIVSGREGCLSVPDFTGNVLRSKIITVEGLGIEGNFLCFESRDFEAVVVQHEIDHLDGILFLDRVSSLKTDVFRRKNY